MKAIVCSRNIGVLIKMLSASLVYIYIYIGNVTFRHTDTKVRLLKQTKFLDRI